MYLYEIVGFLDKYCNYCLRQIKYSFISLVNVRFAFKNYLGTWKYSLFLFFEFAFMFVLFGFKLFDVVVCFY